MRLLNTSLRLNRRHALILGLCAGGTLLYNLVLLVVLLLHPRDTPAIDDIAQFLGPLLVLPLCGWWPGCWRGAPGRAGTLRIPLWIGAGVLAFAVGQIVWSWYELVLKQDTPFPSLADVFFLMEYPCLLAAILLLPQRERSLSSRIRLALDGAMVLTALATLSWYFILGPTWMHSGESPLARVIGTAYPGWDVALLAMVLVTLPRLGRGNAFAAGIVVAAGLIEAVAADSFFDYATLHGSYATGNLLDVLFPAGCMTTALGAGMIRLPLFHRARLASHRHRAGVARAVRIWSSMTPYALLPPVIALFVYINHVSRDQTLRPGVEVGCACLLTLLLLRQVLALRENNRLSQRLQANNAALRAANRRLAELATTDPHTGLPNHRAMVTALNAELERAYRYNRPCSLLFIDIDHFKSVNDGLGHGAGDAVLKEFALVLRGSLRSIDVLGRWGGEEFVTILPECAAGESLRTAERLRAAVAGHAFAVGAGLRLTCSIGVSSYPADSFDADRLLDLSDRAMYTAKRLGRNQVRAAADPCVQMLEPMEAVQTRDDSSLLGVVEALGALVDARDHYTASHSANVARLAARLALELGLDAGAAHRVGLCARLHDVGKVAVPDAVLCKQGRLSAEEWELIRHHPVVGAEVVARIPGLRHVAPIVRAHHEHWDGTGYPDGLRADAIPLEARIIAVTDTFTALTTERPYRRGMSRWEALAEIRRCAGSQFDPAVVAAFVRTMIADEDRVSAEATFAG